MSKLYTGAEIVFKSLEDQGVSNIFGPCTIISDSAIEILEKILKK